MNTIATVSDIAYAIMQLGTTKEQVYYSLLSRDIKGIRNKACSCPIARYLQQETGDPKILVGNCDAGHDGEDAYIPLYVREFIQAFDRGAYPELEMNT